MNGSRKGRGTDMMISAKSICLAVALALVGTGAYAQGNARAQRLREHERRIQDIIKERQAARQKELAAQRAEEAKGAPVPGNTVEEAPKKEEGTRALSNVVMGIKFLNEQGDSSYNIIIGNETTFVTEVYLFNIDQNPVDRVRLALSYDKRFIEPLRVFDTSLRAASAEPPIFSREDRESYLLYDAKLKEPLRSPEVVLLRIMWRALRPTPYTGIDFVFSALERDEDTHTAIYAKGTNILGVPDDPADGVLSGGLMIEDPRDVGDRVLQGKAEELREMYLGGVASDTKVGMQLVRDAQPVKVGDRFAVSVRLNNPEGALVDSVSFAVLFDPKVLQVYDKDDFNAIIRGVNAHDGLYQRNFPWDIHRKNEARNDRGLIEYSMALSNGGSLPSRAFADIYFVAIAPADKTQVSFVKGRPGAPDLTSIRYFGYERLELSPPMSAPSISFRVENAPVEVATRPVEEAVSPVRRADKMAVRKLKLER